MGFWEIFYSLCEKNGKKPNPVAAELGFSSGAVTSWKRGKIPHADKLYRFADYFGVSVDYLLGKTDTPEPGTVINIFDIPGIEPMPKTKKLPCSETSPVAIPSLQRRTLRDILNWKRGSRLTLRSAAVGTA